jgi:membrane-bound metal-dependent hydrolase YbcI (DUF457 family)
MMGDSHALTGVVAGIIAAHAFDSTWAAIGVGAVALLGATLVPDLDCGSSTVANTAGWLTRLLSWVIRKSTGGHRTATHSILGAASLAVLAQVAIDHRDQGWAIAVLTVILFLCIAGPLRLLHIRGILDDLIPAPIALGMVMWDAVPLDLVPVSLFIGVLVHILGDMITKMGCPVLWPLSSDKINLARLKAGGWTERKILKPVFVVAIPVALFWPLIDPYWVDMLASLTQHLGR